MPAPGIGGLPNHRALTFAAWIIAHDRKNISDPWRGMFNDPDGLRELVPMLKSPSGQTIPLPISLPTCTMSGGTSHVLWKTAVATVLTNQLADWLGLHFAVFIIA
jgi:hypothetical protein